MKYPKWFKPELSLGSAIGGFVTVIAIPWVKFVTLAIFAMQSDIAVIKAAILQDGATVTPPRIENVVTNQKKVGGS